MALSNLLVPNNYDLFCKSMTFSTSGGIPSSLNYYEVGTFFVTFTGPVIVAPVQTLVFFIRIGNFVLLQFPDFIVNTATGGSGSINAVAGSIPAKLRNTALPRILNFALRIQNNNAIDNTPGLMQMNILDGSIVITRAFNNNAFNGAGTGGFFSMSASYVIDA